MKLRYLLVTLLGIVMVALLGSTLRVNYLQTVGVLNKNWQREIDLTVSSMAGTLARWAGGGLDSEAFEKEADSVISNEVVRGACLEIDLRTDGGEPVYGWENGTMSEEVGLLRIFTKQSAASEKQNLSAGLTRIGTDTSGEEMASEEQMVRQCLFCAEC